MCGCAGEGGMRGYVCEGEEFREQAYSVSIYIYTNKMLIGYFFPGTALIIYFVVLGISHSIVSIIQ